MKRRHFLGVTLANERRLRVIKAADYTAFEERRRRNRAFASVVAGVCLAIVFVGGIVALMLGAQ